MAEHLVVDRGRFRDLALGPNGDLSVEFIAYEYYSREVADMAFAEMRKLYPEWPFMRVDT